MCKWCGRPHKTDKAANKCVKQHSRESMKTIIRKAEKRNG